MTATARARDHEQTADWPRPRSATGSQPALRESDVGDVVLDQGELERRLQEREAARRAKAVGTAKTVGLILGIIITLATTTLSVAGWWTQRIRADVEREAATHQRDLRLDHVEAGLADVERVMSLERIERAHQQTMLEMILKGQGQEPPKPPKEVREATAEIDQILAK